MERSQPSRILRFEGAERAIHWAIAVPFLACFVTAVVLVLVYNPHPERPFRAAVSWTHRISGVCLFAAPLIVLARNRRALRIYWSNIKEAVTFGSDEIRWLALSGPAALGLVRRLPEQGKFNAAEKLNFMMVMGSWPLFSATGLLIWLPGIAFFAWMIHVGMAALAAPLVIGHIFMAAVNPSTRVGLSGMISGYVDREWARHHYTRWYRDRFERQAPEVRAERRPPQPAPSAVVPARFTTLVHCPSCRTEHAVGSWDRLVERVFTARPLPCPGCGKDLDVFSMVAAAGDLERILDQLDRGGADRPARPRTPAAEAPMRARPLPGMPRRRPTSVPVSTMAVATPRSG